MKVKQALIMICAILMASSVLAELPFTFGTISPSEMEIDYYREKYPGESAVVIGDIGHCRMRPDRRSGFVLLFERVFRIVILNEEGLEFGNFSIPVYESPWRREKIRSFRAYVYNMNENEEIHTIKIKSRDGLNTQLNDRYKEKTFSLPNIKPGSVIEIRYTLESFFIFNLRNWYFQNVIPVEYSEFNLNMHPWFKYTARFKGSFDLDVNEQIYSTGAQRLKDIFLGEGRNIRYRWVAKNIAPLKEEPYTDNLKNYLGQIYFEMTSIYPPNKPAIHYSPSWSHAALYFLEKANFGGYIEAAEDACMDHFPQDSIKENEEAIAYALKTTHDQIKWNHNSSNLTYSHPKEVLERGFGNSAEINLFLVAVLRKLGVDAYPVALSTVNNGSLFSDSPTISQWNYIVAMAMLPDSTQVLLDATVPKPIPGYIPLRAQNGRMRIIDLERNDWVMTYGSGSGYNEIRTYNLALDDGGNLTGNLEILFEDYAAYLMFQRLELEAEQEIADMLASQTGATISNVVIEKVDTGNICVAVKADMIINGYCQKIGEEMLIPAMLFETITENPFWSEQRLYPVKYPYASIISYAVNLEKPKGFKVTYLPESKTSTWGGFHYKFDFSEIGNTIKIEAIRQIATRTIHSNQYPYFKSHMDKMIEDNIDNIILAPME
ncbi:MAG: DUF3857 domain-containing protein [Bacteroidota bacterium]